MKPGGEVFQLMTTRLMPLQCVYDDDLLPLREINLDEDVK